MPKRQSLQGIALLFILLAALQSGCATKAGGGGGVPSIWPIPTQGMVISSPFGMRPQPPSGRMRLHKGVDLQVPEGTPVYVTADGIVSFSGEQRDYGNIIVVDHANDLQTAYAHLKKRRVKQGDAVAQGQLIGNVGKSGNATTWHLHYEVRRKGVPIDPMPYLPRR